MATELTLEVGSVPTDALEQSTIRALLFSREAVLQFAQEHNQLRKANSENAGVFNREWFNAITGFMQYRLVKDSSQLSGRFGYRPVLLKWPLELIDD